jgi:Fe-S cluster biogenesis protein NfuA
MNATTDTVLIRIQPTPNPNALKFVMNMPVKMSGKATFSRPSEAVTVRLANDLFMIEGVRQLHFFENVVTVTYADDAYVDTLQLEVKAVLHTRMPTHDPNFLLEEEKKIVDRSSLSPDLQRIEQILDETVRMFLQGDGGDIEVLRYESHRLDVRYQGACGTCPSSVGATLDAIQGILREQFDPEIEVVPVY